MLSIITKVLEDLGAGDLPVITVWNKVDQCPQPAKVLEIAARRRKTVAISARNGEGVERLMDIIETELSKQLKDIHCLVPYSKVITSFASLFPQLCVYRKASILGMPRMLYLVSNLHSILLIKHCLHVIVISGPRKLSYKHRSWLLYSGPCILASS